MVTKKTYQEVSFCSPPPPAREREEKERGRGRCCFIKRWLWKKEKITVKYCKQTGHSCGLPFSSQNHTTSCSSSVKFIRMSNTINCKTKPTKKNKKSIVLKTRMRSRLTSLTTRASNYSFVKEWLDNSRCFLQADNIMEPGFCGLLLISISSYCTNNSTISSNDQLTGSMFCKKLMRYTHLC